MFQAGDRSSFFPLANGDRPLRQTRQVRAAVFQLDGNHLASADNDGYVKIWDAEQGGLRQEWQDAGEVQSLAISPNGRLLAAGSKEGLIRLYSLPEGRVSHILAASTYGARSLAFSTDSRTLASGGEDQAVTLWHVATGQQLLRLPGVTAQVNGLAFAPDGQTLAAATHDGKLTLWRAPRSE